MSAMDAVNAYYSAFGTKDPEAMRSVLAPDFTFVGPLMTASSADEFITAIAAMPMEATFANSRFVADGDHVAHTYTFNMTAPAAASVPMCEVFDVAGGRIQRAELYYDPRLFPMPPAGGE